MIPERLAYLEAREKAASFLKEKYGFREIFRDNEILTLDNAKCSIHLTLQIPDDVEVYLTLSRQHPSTETKFFSHLFNQYKDLDKTQAVLDELYKDVRKEENLVVITYQSMIVMIEYLAKTHPTSFSKQ
jgi:hypothetical protein